MLGEGRWLKWEANRLVSSDGPKREFASSLESVLPEGESNGHANKYSQSNTAYVPTDRSDTRLVRAKDPRQARTSEKRQRRSRESESLHV